MQKSLKTKILFVLFIISMNVSYSQIQKEKILVENFVEFYKYQQENNPPMDAIKFLLKVTNKSNKSIPDLGVTNRSKHVNFYINGKLNNPVSLYNGLEATNTNKTIHADSSQVYELSWVLTTDNGLSSYYGNEFTIQWEYMLIKSPIIKINLLNKTFAILK